MVDSQSWTVSGVRDIAGVESLRKISTNGTPGLGIGMGGVVMSWANLDLML